MGEYGMKISALGECAKFSAFGNKNSSPNALNEKKYIRRMRGMKLSALGDYIERHKFASVNNWPKPKI